GSARPGGVGGGGGGAALRRPRTAAPPVRAAGARAPGHGDERPTRAGRGLLRAARGGPARSPAPDRSLHGLRPAASLRRPGARRGRGRARLRGVSPRRRREPALRSPGGHAQAAARALLGGGPAAQPRRRPGRGAGRPAGGAARAADGALPPVVALHRPDSPPAPDGVAARAV